MAKGFTGGGTAHAIKIIRKDPCAYCGKHYKYPKSHKRAGKLHATIDHIHPKSMGGHNHWVNYTAACPHCNSRKGNNSLLGYLIESDIPSSHADVEGDLPGLWYDPLGMLLGQHLTKTRA